MQKGRRSKTKRHQEATHDSQLDGGFRLTSTLLSSDPALLRRPRFPAQNMQYHRLDATRGGALPPDGPGEPVAGQ